MAFIPKYLSFHLAIGLLLHLVQGNEEVSLGVEFQHSKYEEIAVQKSSLILNCSVTSTDLSKPLTYIWHKDGLPLNSPRVELLNNGSLYFKKIRKNKKWNDEGVYQCIANNSIGKILASAILVKIRSIARNFTNEPTPYQGYLGGVARFECNINSVPPMSYRWQKDRKDIPQDIRYTTFSSGVLQITNLTYEDAGMYRCVAISSGLNNGNGGDTASKVKNSREGQLSVLNGPLQRDPFIVAGPQNKVGILGKSLVLECLIGGKPLPKVVWTRKDNKPVSGKLHGQGNLLFTELTENDEGTYVCSSDSLSNKISAEANVTIHSPPVVKTAMKSQKWPVSRNVIFKCVIDGIPKPEIKWYLNGKLIETTSKRLDLRSNKLVVFFADPSHSGYYQCVGENALGRVISTAYLEIFKKVGSPEQPSNINGTAVSSTSIDLTWLPVSTSSKLLTYIVMYTKESGPMDTMFVQSTNCTISDLEPNTYYTMFVKSVNKVGASPASKSVLVLTKEDKPIGAPKISLSSTEADNIIVLWDELANSIARGKIVQYSVYHRRGPGSHEYVNEVDGNEKQFVIQGLDTDSDYEVRVKAATSVGYPNLSENEWPWVKYHTPKSSNPYLPFAPRLRIPFINSTCASFKWEIKDLTDDTTYDLTFRNLKTDTIIDSVTLKAPTSSYTLCNLENNTAYEVTMITKNSYGTSSPSSKEFSTSDNSVLHPPENVQAKALSADTVWLSWSEGRGVQEADTYEICYHPVANESLMKCVESVITNMKINGLKPFTLYSFKVRARIPDQVTAFSKTITIRTKQDVPSAPTNITWKIVSPGIVEIHWRPPSEPNGVITSYIIFYNHDDSLPDRKWNNVTQEGVITTARVDELTAASYYVKLSACTEAGQGWPSQVITVYPRPCVEGHQDIYPCTTDMQGKSSKLTGQQVGIIVGVTIGVLCIIICILVIVFRRKCFYNENHHNLPPQPFQGNGHLPRAGNGHVHRSSEHIPMDRHDADAFTPMLTKLPENEQSDSKGGGPMIVTPNGVKARGFSCQNGHIANGHVPTFNCSNNSHHDVSSNTEEHHGLIAAMLAATDGSLTGEGSDSAANCSSVVEGDSGSLEDIDHSVGSAEDNIRSAAEPSSQVDGDPCLIEAATPAVITDTGQARSKSSPPQQLDGSLLRNKPHQSTSTSPCRTQEELPPPPPHPLQSTTMSQPGLTLNSVPPAVNENSTTAPHQIQTTVRDGRTVSAAKNSHSVV